MPRFSGNNNRRDGGRTDLPASVYVDSSRRNSMVVAHFNYLNQPLQKQTASTPSPTGPKQASATVYYLLHGLSMTTPPGCAGPVSSATCATSHS